jgi:hypothetical protein
MAHSLKSQMSIAAAGVPQIVGSFDKFANDASPKYNIGFKVELNDGTVYRYAQFGAAVGPGKMVSQDLSESSVVDTDGVAIADAAIGSKTPRLVLASVTSNQYAGGKIVATDDAGEGYTYDIVSNTASATIDSVANMVVFTIAQPLQVAWVTTATDFAIIGNLYSNLEIATTTDTVASGVTAGNMTKDYWGWVQTEGQVGVLTGGTLVLGSNCILDTAGDLTPAVETDILERVAVSQVVGDDTGYTIVSLRLK